LEDFGQNEEGLVDALLFQAGFLEIMLCDQVRGKRS
jgi:hypothetical protein